MSDDHDLLALENQVCFGLAVAARSVVGLYRPILEPLGLTHPQYLVMLALWQNRTRTVGQLGEALQLDSATVSPLVKRLESEGLVTRSRSTDDERVLIVGLTDAGAALRERATAVPGEVVSRLGLELEELDALRTALVSFVAASTRAQGKLR
jgi:DNA-binding MarR family transcriptional regulator